MNGPKHYAMAETLLKGAGDVNADGDFLVALAQVHATLALAAATVLYKSDETWRPAEGAWADVIS